MRKTYPLLILGTGIAGCSAYTAARTYHPELTICLLDRDESPLRLQLPRLEEDMQLSTDSASALTSHFALPYANAETGKTLWTAYHNWCCEIISASEVSWSRDFQSLNIDSANLYGEGSFRFWPRQGEAVDAQRVILATGSRPASAGWKLAESLGHQPRIGPCVFLNLKSTDRKLKRLKPFSMPQVRLRLAQAGDWPAIEVNGPMEITARGLRGPAVRTLTNLAATRLEREKYQGELEIHWFPQQWQGQPTQMLAEHQQAHSHQTLGQAAPLTLPAPLWTLLLKGAKLEPDAPWRSLTSRQLQKLAGQMTETHISFDGYFTEHGESGYSGGFPLDEVNRQTGESLKQPGCYLTGGLLDWEAETGLQHRIAAWHSGQVAGQAAAMSLMQT